MSFRTQLVLAAAYLLTAVVLALEIPLAVNVERRAASELQADALGRASILAARVADPVADGARARVARLVETAARRGDERIVVVDSRGRVVADSAGSASAGAAWATAERPELRAALLQGRIDVRRRDSESLGGELLLVTVPLVQDERVTGAVRTSLPTSAERASVRESWLRLALIGLAVILAGLVLAWILAGRLARVIELLGRAADRVGRGELHESPEVESPRELAALSGSLARMTAALRSNVAAQQDLLANVSHQLRTPLTSIRLRLEAIEEEGGWTGEQAAKAETELDRLNQLVEDMLDLARASSPDLQGEPVDLAAAAHEAAERWQDAVAAAEQRVVVRTNGEAPAWASRRDVADVLDALIENAVRYAGPGAEIVVEADGSDGAARVSVNDDGPGIPADERQRVFERFYRGSTGRGTSPGTGLGLAIAAELARRWGGDVALREGRGTRVDAVFSRPPTNP